MLLIQRISNELRVLADLERWLHDSLTQDGQWNNETDRLAHERKIKDVHAASLQERYGTGTFSAEMVSDLLIAEFSRQSGLIDLLVFALDKCKWNGDFQFKGRILKEKCQQLIVD